MKKLLFGIIVSGMLAGCYEDKGSYNYHFDEMNQIDSVMFTPAPINTINGKTIEFQQPLNEEESVRRIEVQLKQSLADNIDNLDFAWYVSHQEDGKTVKDTVRTPGYLDVKLKVGEATSYNVLLAVTDKTTTLAKYTALSVQTRPIYKNSLFVLHGTNGNARLGNIETIGADTKVRMDAYATVYPGEENKFKNTVGLVYTAYNEFSTNKTKSSIAFLNNDGTSSIFNPFGLESKLNSGYVLPKSDQPFTYKYFMSVGDAGSFNDYKFMISQEGRFYLTKTMLSFKVPGEGDPENPAHQTDYRVTAGTVTEDYFVFWDAKNSRFLAVSKSGDSYVDYSEEAAQYAQLKNPVLDAHVDTGELEKLGISPKGKDGVYAFINYRDNFSEAHPFFIFHDKAAGKYYLYELTPQGGGKSRALLKDDGKDEGAGGDPLFSITGKELTSKFNPGNDNLIMYNSWFTSNYVFFANGDKLYRYNNGNGDRVEIWQAPEGYTISTFKIRSIDKNTYMGDLGRYISIGLNKGGEGAVTEIKLTTSADLDEDFQSEVYSQDEEGNKFGNIMDLQFAYEYTYQLPNYNQ